MTGKIPVCFCNNITADKIVEVVKNGATTVEKVKERTQAAGGRCNGFRCKKAIEDIIEANK